MVSVAQGFTLNPRLVGCRKEYRANLGYRIKMDYCAVYERICMLLPPVDDTN